MEHHIFLGPWHQEYPDARVIGPEGLPEKRAKQGNEDVPFSTVFTKADYGKTRVDDEFDAEFDYEYVHAHVNKELVFLAKRDKTLVEADLMFNLPAEEQYSKAGGPGGGILSKLFQHFQGTAHGTIKWQQRFIWYGASSGDRPAFNASVSKIARWDFEKIIPCHGETIESEGQDVFKRLFAWHIDATGSAKAGKSD